MSSFWSQGQHVADSIIAMVAAYLFTLPLGWERKTKSTVGLGSRTLPLVALGSCGWLLISRYLQERGIYDADGIARALRAMMTGIGFIGGGAILKTGEVQGVAGLTTAASVWAAGAIGAATAHGHYVVAAALAATSFLLVAVSDVLGPRAESRSRPEPSESG